MVTCLPPLIMILNLLLPLIQCLAIRSITNLLCSDPSYESRGYDSQPQWLWGHMMAPQGYSVSGFCWHATW